MKDKPNRKIQAYYLIERDGWYGIFFNDSLRVDLISRNRKDAEAVLKKLREPEPRVFKKGLDEVLEDMEKKTGGMKEK